MEMIGLFLFIVFIAPCLLAIAIGVIVAVVAVGVFLWATHMILGIIYTAVVLFSISYFVKRKLNEYYGKGYFINIWKEKRAKHHG